MVSSMLSPLTREDSCTSRLTTSAPSRLAASSKDTRVRVDGSVNRLATVTPARDFFCTGGWPTGRTNFCARVSSASICALPRPSRVSRWRREPLFLVCTVMSGSLLREPSFQDDGRRGRIHVFFRHPPPAFTAGARVPQPFLGVLRGPALVDQVDGYPEALRELGGELARGAGERAHRAVGIIGLADHDARRARVGQYAFESRPVGAAGMIRDGGAGMRAAGQGVAARDANTPESEVDGKDDLCPVRHVQRMT